MHDARDVVITGWGTGHALAAVVALQKFPNADLRVSSARRLPGLLDELSGAEQKYDCVMVLGVYLGSAPDCLIQAVRKLNRRGTSLTYITVFSPPHDIADALDSLANVEVCLGSGTLAHAVAATLGDVMKAERAAGILRQLQKKPNRLNDSERLRAELLEAAASRYRRFQDAQPYIEAIIGIARGMPVSDRQRAIVEEYRRNGQRELRGCSDAIEKLRALIDHIAASDCRALITGETGVGKETVASLIHGKSGRNAEPFIAFNCADLSPQLLESRLFGHEKGAFTGAEKVRKGAFELADGGTLFLDEVGELPPGAQAGLLRVLQEGRFYRLGGEIEIETDVRIIAATNRDLEQMVREGEFREDLYYRLNTIVIDVPPLRERPEDIEPIAECCLRRNGWPGLTARQIQQLKSYPWPGNVRELQNMLERAHVLHESDFDRLLPRTSTLLPAASDLLEDVIRAHVAAVYARCGNNKTRTAKALGIAVNTLKKYLR